MTPISFVMVWPRRILTGTIRGFCIRSLGGGGMDGDGDGDGVGG